MKKMMTARDGDYTHYKYEPGEKILMKDKDKEVWDEARVHNQD